MILKKRQCVDDSLPDFLIVRSGPINWSVNLPTIYDFEVSERSLIKVMLAGVKAETTCNIGKELNYNRRCKLGNTTKWLENVGKRKKELIRGNGGQTRQF